MEQQIYTSPELHEEFKKVKAAYTELFNELDTQQVNKIPYQGSWTAAQVLEHITKSIADAPKVLGTPTEPMQRDPQEKIEGLRKTFLDFSTKMKSPAFIEPSEVFHDKETTLANFNNNFEALIKITPSANDNDVVKNTPFGDISKLELLHFFLFHSQRHLHQLQNMKPIITTEQK